MTTILLMRHAKAEKPAAGLEDFDRGLQSVGRADAQAMGRMLVSRFGQPERVVCSTAKRTRETLAALGLDHAESRTSFSDALFEATHDSCIGALRGEDADTILLVGHNPGTHDAAMALISDGDSTAWTKLAAAFPTASVAVLEFSGPLGDLKNGSCFLRDFLTPEDLPA